MTDLPDSSSSVVRLEKSRISASLAHEEKSQIRPRTPSSQPSIPHSLASLIHANDVRQNTSAEESTSDYIETELSGESLAPEDHGHPSLTDFRSVLTVKDFGFASSWSRQVQDYAANKHSKDIYSGPGRDEQQEEADQSSTGKSPLRPSNDLGSFEGQSPPISSTRSLTVQESNEGPRGPIVDGRRSNDLVSEFCERLLGECEYSQHGPPDSQFIPHDKLCTTLNDSNVLCLLEHIFPLEAGTRLHKRAAEICSREHRSSRRMILAVLVIVGQPNYIDDFIRHNICDVDLPLREPKDHNSGDHHRAKKNFFHKRQDGHGSKPHAFFGHWRRKEMLDFLRWQYAVLSPFLEVGSNRVCFYEIEEKIVLPFIECQEPQKTIGGQGAVWKVKIHPAHHDLERLEASRRPAWTALIFDAKRYQDDENPFFAIKAIYSEKYEDIRDEVRVLERFSGSEKGHNHIIRLLMWFKHGSKYYLLFPWAAGNLADYWKKHPLPTPTLDGTRWLFDQCCGMAGGLSKIHNHSSWSCKRHIPGYQQENSSDKNLGRHGDVKPENLLWFSDESRIVIADFGLTRFHSAQAGSAPTIPQNLRGYSRTYRPPEFSLEAAVTQKCDVWSLGCVYLEYITWYLLGHEKTRGGGADTFVKLRIEDDDQTTRIQEDKFFNVRLNTTQGGGKVEYIADVKESVKTWITHLRQLEHCSAAIGDFLDMITTDMLVPDAPARVEMQHVERRLSKMAELCHTDEEYCTNHTRTAPGREKKEARPAIGELRHSVVIYGSSGYGRFRGPSFAGVDDLDTFIDKEIRGLGSLETSEHTSLTEFGGTGMPEDRVQAPPRNTQVLQEQPATVRPLSILRRSTSKQTIPGLPNKETTLSGLESQNSRAGLNSSFATSITSSSSEEIRDRQHVSWDVPAVISEADKDETTIGDISPKAMDLSKRQDVEVMVLEGSLLSPLSHNPLYLSPNKGDQSSQDTRDSHESNDKDIESGLRPLQEHREEVGKPSSEDLNTLTTSVPDLQPPWWKRMSKGRWARIWASLRKRLSTNNFSKN